MDAHQLKTLKRKNRIKESKTDYVYYVICGLILFLLAVIVIYPLYYMGCNADKVYVDNNCHAPHTGYLPYG